MSDECAVLCGLCPVARFGLLFFFFKQKTAYEMCGRDWSSDVCSSDLAGNPTTTRAARTGAGDAPNGASGSAAGDGDNSPDRKSVV